MRVPFKEALFALLNAVALVPRRVLSSVSGYLLSKFKNQMQCQYSEFANLRSNTGSSTPETLKKFKLLKRMTVLTFSPLWAHLKASEGKRKDRTEEGARGKVSEKARGSVGLPLLSSPHTKNMMYRNRAGATATINHFYLLGKKR